MNTLMAWITAHLFRWLPHRAATGLRAVGNPDENAPVLVTSNFSLTVRRVLRALRGCDVWLLVAPSDGINVWCGACGGIFTHHRVIDAVKVSLLLETVRHRELILPALSAPGMDCREILEATGFHVRFGPVYAKDVPAYLRQNGRKTESMCRFRFDLRHRMDMLLSMNFPIYLALALLVGVFRPQALACASVLFWGAVCLLYLLTPWIPGRTGWAQSLLTGGCVVVLWALADGYFLGDPFIHWGWFPAAIGIFFTVGFDLAGIAAARKSDAEAIVSRLGIRKIGSLFNEKDLGILRLEREACIGCGTCETLCPVGVFSGLDPGGKIAFRDRSACFNCGACVMQCAPGALSLRSASKGESP